VFGQGQVGVTASARDVVAAAPAGSGGRRRERAARLVAVGSVLLSGMALPAVPAPPAAALARAVPVAGRGADPSQTFTYTGGAQTLTVPAGSVVTITADGAGGADNTGTACSATGTGGTGAQVVTTLPQLTAATTFTIAVGGTGGKGCNGTGHGGVGGFNGGAPGGGYPVSGFRGEAPGGGGASSISSGGVLLVVAGGGGAAGGTGGSTAGGNGGSGGTPDATDGTVGSATGQGGSPGQGGGGGSTSTSIAGTGGPGGSVPFCSVTNGGQGSGFSGDTVGLGGTGGSFDGGCAAVPTGAGGGGGGGYFAGGGGGSGAVNSVGTSGSGGGGGAGSSFATPSGTSTTFAKSTIGTANTNGQVTVSYVLPATSTSVTSAPNPSFFGQPVTLTATVTGAYNTPTGTVTFTSGTTTLCANVAFNSSGVATCTTSTLPVGNDTVTATYSGDANNAPSYGSTQQTVNTTVTALVAARATASLIRAGLGGVQVSGLSATLTNKATGDPIAGQTITFTSRVGNQALCSAVTDVNGTARCTATFNNGFAGNILAFDNLVIFGYTATYTATPGYTSSTANARIGISV